MSESYRALLRRLTTLDAEAAAHRDEAIRWHDERVVKADRAVLSAEEDVRSAAQAVREARRRCEAVDARASLLWATFTHAVGSRAERFGSTLPPPTVPLQRDRDADEYLQEAESKARYVPPPRPLTGATTLMFGLFGFIGGVAGVAANQALRWAGREAGGDWAVGLPVVALIVMLSGPVLAVFGAKRVADRRGVGLDATAAATVLVTGLITAGLLFAALGGTKS